MILVDFNQILLSAISAGHATFGSDLNPDMIRHMFLNSILSYKKKFSPTYGQIIICCDGRDNWRKKVYPYYKAKRAEGRAASPLDWEMIFDTLHKLHDELDEFFPYKVVRVYGAEGDDVIAVLAKYFQDNELIQKGLEEVREELLVTSSDKDFVQLQEYGNVAQYSPMLKKMIRELHPRAYRFEKIIRGDVGDGCPNIFSDDDTLVTPGKRQVPVTEKRLAPLLEDILKGIDVPSEHAVNYDRNKIMIDLVDMGCPKEIQEAILDRYKAAKVAPKSALLQYFMKFKLKNLVSDLDKF